MPWPLHVHRDGKGRQQPFHDAGIAVHGSMHEGEHPILIDLQRVAPVLEEVSSHIDVVGVGGPAHIVEEPHGDTSPHHVARHIETLPSQRLQQQPRALSIFQGCLRRLRHVRRDFVLREPVRPHPPHHGLDHTHEPLLGRCSHEAPRAGLVPRRAGLVQQLHRDALILIFDGMQQGGAFVLVLGVHISPSRHRCLDYVEVVPNHHGRDEGRDLEQSACVEVDVRHLLDEEESRFFSLCGNGAEQRVASVQGSVCAVFDVRIDPLPQDQAAEQIDGICLGS